MKKYQVIFPPTTLFSVPNKKAVPNDVSINGQGLEIFTRVSSSSVSLNELLYALAI